MPILQGALLCDAAREYNGLVSVLGGFVSILNVLEVPVPAGVWFAGRIGFTQDELAGSHRIRVRVEDDDGRNLAEVVAVITPTDDQLTTDAPEILWGVNIITPLPFPIAAEGMHWVELLVDDEPSLVRLPLKVILRRPGG